MVSVRLPTMRTRPPLLVPVSRSHIRRVIDDHWPQHAEGCDFFREPAEQRLAIASQRREAAERPLRLAPAVQPAVVELTRTIESRSASYWPGIARLLLRLVWDAGLQRRGPGELVPPVKDYVATLWRAARRIEIDQDVPLPDFLCTSPARLCELVGKIASSRGRFKRNRAHGVLIMRAARIGAGMIEPVAGDPLQVRGRIAVFGERPAEVRDGEAERVARAPYLAACVVGAVEPDGPIEVLSAYAHPCASPWHLMLVDSAQERRTLDQLRRVQTWLADHRGVRFLIEKPVFDTGPSVEDEAPARPPCVPDFLLHPDEEGQQRPPLLIVETMGYSDEKYRRRKERMHRMMRSTCGDAPLVLHEFSGGPGETQAMRDDVFWKAVRLAVIVIQGLVVRQFPVRRRQRDRHFHRVP